MAILNNFNIETILLRNGIGLDYIGYKDRLSDTPLRQGNYVLNMADSLDGTGGTHWVGMMIENNHVVYFDPFGLSPVEVVKQFVRALPPPVFNTEQLQNENSSICGWYVLFFLFYMNKMKTKEPNMETRFKNFLGLFSTDPKQNRTLLQEYLKLVR